MTLHHRQHETGLASDEVGHAVSVLPRTRVWDLFGCSEVGVNSFHHQAIDALAPGLAVAAHAADGIVEAVSMPERGFVVGVQWHPELMFARHPAQTRPFAGLVESAASSLLVAR